MRHTVQHYRQASVITSFEGTAGGDIIVIHGADNAVDPHELASTLNGVVPGFQASYRRPTPELEEAVPSRAELDAAILLVKSNGYDVTKQRNLGAEYVESIRQFVDGIDTTRYSDTLPSQGARRIVEIIELAAGREYAGRGKLDDVEIYIEIDRALLISEMEDAIRTHEYGPAVNSEIWSHLWPVVARIDEQNDVILHVTSGDRAQNGKGI